MSTNDIISKTDEQWKQELTAEQYRVLREKGTEPAFTGAYWNEHNDGMYRCAGCGAALFSSKSKFDSGTGWPSFSASAQPENIQLTTDNSHGVRRTEVLCSSCGGHLGHVFDDGPREKGGKRYCINSCALNLKK